MLCYRCGSHVPDTAESCATCGQKLSGGGLRQATGTFSRRRLQGSVEGAPFKQGDLVANRYEVKDVIGAGPVGFVFRARDGEVDVEVALKVINPRLVQTQDERRQFAKAIRVGRKLSHQNLIRVYEEGQHEDHPFFTMQLLEGLTLRKIIDLRTQKGEFFALSEIEPILGQVANALDSAHKLGTHSNLKPENVIVLPDLLKVSDFGLALAIPPLPFIQAVKHRKGDRYLAPEYSQGGELDQRADIYSLGVIVGEMLCGLTPDGAVPELSRRNPQVPQQLEGLYRRALNSNPLARPKTATEFFDEFSEIARKSGPPPLRPPEAASQPAVPRSRPHVVPAFPALAGGNAPTAELRRARTADKPPPPLEDVNSVDVPLTGASFELLPPDATQPLDASALPPPPPADDGASEETQLMPSFKAPPPVPAPASVPAAPHPRAAPSSRHSNAAPKKAGAAFFLLFTFAGLSLGAAGGYWLLGRTRQPTQAVVSAVDATTQPPVNVTPEPRPTVEEKAATPNGGPSGTAVAGLKAPGAGADERRKPAEAAKAESARLAAEAAEAEAIRLRAAQAREADALRAAEAQKAEEAKRAADAAKRLEEERKAEAARIAAEQRKAQEAARAEEKKKALVVAAAAAKKPGCPDGMKLIAAGAFRMGTARDDPMMGFDERILSSTQVDAFCIDVYEYPNKRGVVPKVGVSWSEAKAACESVGKRLCGEDEWEKACKGPGNARYPYGNTFDADACNTEDELGEDRPIATAGRFSRCRSGYGVADLSGNVAEWTATAYAGNADRAQKGGSYSKPDYAGRCSARKNGAPGSKAQDVGFRCCANP